MEKQEILDFANMTFSMEYGSIDFEERCPKAYSEECCHVPVHHSITENGAVKALLAVYPVTLRLNGSSLLLRAAYIGTVCVHPKSRGKGYMSELMRRAERGASEQGFDLMLLDGERHRYRSYGFERAGMKYHFSVGFHGAWRHCREIYGEGALCIPKYSFEELDGESGCLSFLYSLYQKRTVTARTREEFFPCLNNNCASTFAAFENGVPVGYINLSRDGKTILELAMERSGDIPRLLFDFMEGMELEEVSVNVGADETEMLAPLEAVCDNYCIAASHQMKLLNAEKTLDFLTAWKNRVLAADGKADTRVINSADIRRLWKELEADDMEKLSLLTTCRCFEERQKGQISRLKDIPADWLPLPFFLPDGDSF